MSDLCLLSDHLSRLPAEVQSVLPYLDKAEAILLHVHRQQRKETLADTLSHRTCRTYDYRDRQTRGGGAEALTEEGKQAASANS